MTALLFIYLFIIQYQYNNHSNKIRETGQDSKAHEGTNSCP